MSRLIRPCVLLWIGIALVVAGCATPAAVVLEPKSSPEVHDLAVDGKWLWVATSQGLGRLNQHTLTYEQFSHTGTSRDVPLDLVGTLLVDDQGQLWAGGDGGLARYDDDLGWTTVYTTMEVYSFALDTDGNLWRFFVHPRYINAFRYQGQEPPASGSWESELVHERPAWNDCKAWRFLTVPRWRYSSPAECAAVVKCYEQSSSLTLPREAGTASAPSARHIAQDATGDCWFVHSSYDRYPNLVRWDGKTAQVIPWFLGWARAIVAAGVKDGVWIGSEEGLFYSDGRTIQQYLFVEGKLVDEERVE